MYPAVFDGVVAGRDVELATNCHGSCGIGTPRLSSSARASS
jgi:hypothetical protein